MSPRELEKLLKAVGNRRRIAILQYLKKHHEASVGELANEIHLSFKSTSKHLTVLLSANIVENNQRGGWAVYTIIKEQSPVALKILSLL